jgi:hypothetical protein
MDWTRPVDDYCERLGPGLLAEPVNLATNLAFLISAVIMWRRCAGRPTGRVLAAILFVIGLGSATFHSVATPWASLADVGPIGLFILAYLFVTHRDYLGLPPLGAGLATAVAIAALVLAARELGRLVPAAGANAAYGCVAALILGYGIALMARSPATGTRLILGGLLLCASIAARALDMPLCPRWPLGTHFLWHLINAVLLGWMIETWRRHAPPRAPASA